MHIYAKTILLQNAVCIIEFFLQLYILLLLDQVLLLCCMYTFIVDTPQPRLKKYCTRLRVCVPDFDNELLTLYTIKKSCTFISYTSKKGDVGVQFSVKIRHANSKWMEFVHLKACTVPFRQYIQLRYDLTSGKCRIIGTASVSRQLGDEEVRLMNYLIERDIEAVKKSSED